MASLSVDNLKVAYRGVILALQGVSLRAGPGEAIGILGPNGAGKSTLVRALSGLLPQYDGRVVEGTISVGGRDTTHAPALAVAGHGLTAV
ncbi:MAG: ATP-binding cassette domain-containing protein, partial [Deinococcus sp.]|nr:ATP-binding cassette domain-containing protein [Deinococcus sp.]